MLHGEAHIRKGYWKGKGCKRHWKRLTETLMLAWFIFLP